MCKAVKCYCDNAKIQIGDSCKEKVVLGESIDEVIRRWCRFFHTLALHASDHAYFSANSRPISNLNYALNHKYNPLV